MPETLSIRQARRLALARAGLLKRSWTGLPRRASGRGTRARKAAHEVIRRFGYLQLDTVSIVGARSHALVLHSRLDGFDPAVGEELLAPGAPLFEYWGHEASWIPMELYPAFEFRRRAYEDRHPWWGKLLDEHPELTREIKARLRDEGPLPSSELGSSSGDGWWDLQAAKKVVSALWSAGEVVVRERRHFRRTYDLTERVIPEEVRNQPLDLDDGLKTLLLKALDGHGWASVGTLAATWRLKNRRDEIHRLLAELEEEGRIVACELVDGEDRRAGYVRPEDLELAARLESVRPRRDLGVLLSPFDPVLWDRARVKQLFGFEQVLEIYKPAEKRIYGYYCLPVLAGEHLVGRVDLKADRKAKKLRVLSSHYEKEISTARGAVDREAARFAVERTARALGLEAVGKF